MGFVGKILGNVDNVQYYYIIGLLIFMGLFALIIVRTIRMKKSEILSIKTAILDDKDNNELIHSKQ